MKNLRQNGKGSLAQNPEVFPSCLTLSGWLQRPFPREALMAKRGRPNLQQALVPAAESRDRQGVQDLTFWSCLQGRTLGLYSLWKMTKNGPPWRSASVRPAHQGRACMIRIDFFFLKKNQDHEAITHCSFSSVYKDNTTSLQTIQTIQKGRRKNLPLFLLLPQITNAEISETIKDHHSKILRYTCI